MVERKAHVAIGIGMLASVPACADFDRLDECSRRPCASASTDAGARDARAADDAHVDAASSDEIVVRGEAGVFALAWGGATLHWATAAPTARIASCSPPACESPRVVASGGNPTSLAWSTRLLWSDAQSTHAGLGFDTANGVQSLDVNQPGTWVTSHVDTFLVLKNGDIVKVIGDPPGDRSTVLPFSVIARRASVRGGWLAWIADDGAVYACVPSQCPSASAALVAKDDASSLAVDEGRVFWTTTDGRVRSAALTATGATGVGDVATGFAEPVSVAIDPVAPWLYVAARGTAAAAYGDGRVAKINKAGGEVMTIASGQARPESVIVTDAHVVWANAYDGTIRRAPK